MTSPIPVLYDPNMTEEERAAQQAENNRLAAEAQDRMMQRIIDGSKYFDGTGLRDIGITPSFTAEPSVKPTNTIGFRPVNSNFNSTPITMGPLSDFDSSIFEDYTPTYVETPVYNSTTNTYVPDRGGEDAPSSPAIHDYGGDVSGYKGGGGNYDSGPGDKGHDSGPSGTHDDKGGYGGGTMNDMAFNSGGMVPPVYAQTGVSPAQLATNEALERYERERKKQSTLGTIDAAAQGLGTFNTMTQIANSPFLNPAQTIALGMYNLYNSIQEQGLVKGLIPDFLEEKFNLPTNDSNKDSEDPFKDSRPAFDPSPGNIDPSTGQPITNYGAILGDYSPPSINLTTTGSLVDYESGFLKDLKAEIAKTDANFKAEQKAKAQARIDAALAAATANSNSDSSFNRDEYDAAGGWGPDVGGYNDPGAFGGKMGSSPGDKSSW